MNTGRAISSVPMPPGGSARPLPGPLRTRPGPYEIAGIVAKRHSGCNNVTTAAIDHLDFKDGAYVNDLLVIIGYVTYTGNTSMEVRIDTYVENNEGMRHPINRAFFVMVAMGANNRPTKVPPLIIENEFQQAEWDCALKRKENRIKMKNDF